MKEKFVISLISQLSSNLIYLFAFYLLFYNLPESTIGIWRLMNGIVNLGFLFINIGLDTIHYQYSGKEESYTYFGTYFSIKIILLGINILVTIIILSFVSQLTLWEIRFNYYIILLLFSKILFNISNIFFINLRTKIKVFKTEIPFFLITFAKGIAVLILALNTDYFTDAIFYLSFVNFFFNLVFLVLIIGFSRKEFSINSFNKSLAVKYIKDIKPLFLFSITMVVANNLGDLILDYFFGHTTLGHFSLVNNYIVPTLLMISGSIITIYLTLFSKYFERENFSEIKRITYIIEKYSSIIYLTFAIIILLNGGLMITLFLPNYLAAIPILYIMIFIPYLVGVTQPYSYHFVAGKKQNVNANINILTRILIILLMIFLIPKSLFFFPTLGLGSIGYAIAQTIPWILWAFMNRYYSYKLFQIKPQKKILIHLLLASSSFLINLFLKNFIFTFYIQNEILLLVITTFLSFGTFMVLLFISKDLKRGDLKFLIEMIKFDTYKKSLKDEFSNTN